MGYSSGLPPVPFCPGSGATGHLYSEFPFCGGVAGQSFGGKDLLYADDALLYLHDANSFLRAVLAIFDKFGRFSGVQISWSKTVLFHLDIGAREIMAVTSVTDVSW